MKNYIWLIAAAVVLVAMVLWVYRCPIFENDCECQEGQANCDKPVTAGDRPDPNLTPTPIPRITISIASSNTKENWIDAVVKRFNQELRQIASGATIFVEVEHVTSGVSQKEILRQKLQPTVWIAPKRCP